MPHSPTVTFTKPSRSQIVVTKVQFTQNINLYYGKITHRNLY